MFTTGVKGTGYYRDTPLKAEPVSVVEVSGLVPRETVQTEEPGTTQAPKQRPPVSEIQARRNRGRNKADEIDPMDPVSSSAYPAGLTHIAIRSAMY